MLKQFLFSLFKTKSVSAAKSDLPPLTKQEINELLQEAMALHQRGDYVAAENIYETVLNDDPANFNALHLLGLIRHQQKKHTEAIKFISLAIDVDPTFVEAYINLGIVLREEDEYEKALSCFDKALSLNPESLDALLQRARLLLDTQKTFECLAVIDQYLALNKNNTDPYFIKAAALNFLGRFEESLDCYNKAINLKSDIEDYYNNRGNLLREMHQFDAALKDYEKAIQLNPKLWLSIQNEGLTKLLLGDYENGWEGYEVRLNSELMTDLINIPNPIWTGEQNIKGKKILLVAEQGLGDTIFFSRYFNKIVELGASIHLCVPPPLIKIYKDAPGIEKVMTEVEGIPDVDFYCYIMSLAKIFKTTLGSIPSPEFTFSVPNSLVEQLSHNLKEIKKPHIGIFWKSTTTQRVKNIGKLDVVSKKNLDVRNISLSELSIIFSVDASFITLQKEITEEDSEELKKYENIYNISDQLMDFVDTAALIKNLDLVITIDTSIAHLAGVLGKPVWILLPYNADWRWLIDRDDSPWYPTATLFRQTRYQSWDDPLTQIKQQLMERFD